MDFDGYTYSGLYAPFSSAPSISSISSRSDSRNSIILPGRGGSSQGSSSNGGGSGYARRNPRNFKRGNARDNRERDYKPFRDNRGENQNPRQLRGRHNSGFCSSSPQPPIQYNDKAESKNYVCPDCKQPYSYFKNNNVLYGRIPRVLPCEHTICEECINKSIKTINQIRCATCTRSFTSKKNETFDYNHYILGQITCSKINVGGPIDFSSVTLVSTGRKLQKSSNSSTIGLDFQEKCGLGGCQNVGTVSCLDCCGVYCNACDETLHNSGKQLMSHKRNEIGIVSFELNKCLDHSMMEELYCNDCEVNCCCYCVLEKHEGHPRSYLVRLDEEEELELREAYATASRTLTQLEITQKKTKKPESDKVSELELEISRKFSDIHAKLHLIEKKLCKEARQFKSCHPSSNEFDRLINSNIDNLKYLMLCVDRREETKLNLKSLLTKLKEMEKLPSFLVTNTNTAADVKLVVDDRIKELGNYFKLTVPTESFKLVTAAELPDDSKVEATSALRKNGVTSQKPKSEFKQTKKTKPKILESRRKKDQATACKNNFDNETVYITHMHSLDCFYVQFKKEEQQYKELQREIKNHVDNTELGVNEVYQNELYMAPCLGNEKEWGRVRALEEFEEEGDTKYRVMFIDFGNSSDFSKTQLKYISSYLANKRPFAVQCRLDNPSKNEWATGTHLKLAQLLSGNTEVVMFTKEFSNNIYTVDLNISTSLGELQSVTDLLIVGCNALQVNFEEPGKSSSQIFDNSDTFSKGESYEVFIRYVLDPWRIFIQKASYASSLNNLVDLMAQHYTGTQCDIHLPVKNSDVVILYHSQDFGNWHRARILEVFNNKKIVNVSLVDWGKQVNISWKNLRKLVEKFKRMECLVVSAKLADIAPKYEAGWSHLKDSHAREFIEKYSFKSKQIKMLVSESAPLEVVLFESQPTYDENINALLVEHDLVLSSGKLSQTVKWPRKKTEEKSDENEFLPIYKDYFDDEDETDEESQGIKTQVKIVRFDDPYSIHVAFVSREEEAEKLHEELQIHYKQEFDVQDSWNVGDKVVVFDSSDRSYYRGRILKIEEDGRYSVYLLDRGEHINVPQQDLRRISQYFSNNFPNMVLKCHLSNIKPAGGVNKWSSMSFEWFEKLFKKYKDIYLQKVSDDQSRLSIPVTMWYSKIIQGTALEPSRCKFISIDKKVIKAGLAFPVISDVPKVSPVQKFDLDKPCTSSTIREQNGDIHTSKEVIDLSKDPLPVLVEPIPDAQQAIDESEPSSSDADECSVLQWRSSDPLTETEFYAYITCAESEGYLFVRDQRLHPLYKELEENMKKTFDELPKAKHFELRQNQMVTVWSDGFWYRGTVLSVINKTKAKVMMIDFGSDHEVNIDHLHKRFMYPEVPIMVTKIKLYDVHSKTASWSAADVDILLDTVSEYSKIVLRSNPSVEIPLADVYDVNGVCLNDQLVKLSPNLYRSKTNKEQEETTEDSTSEDGVCDFDDSETSEDQVTEISFSKSTAWSSQVDETEIEDKEVAKDYNYVKLPKMLPGQKMAMDIVSVLDYKTVSIYVVDDDTKVEVFDTLSKSIQEEAGNLEPLANLEIGMPCISRFTEDNEWYRAKIFEISAEDCGYATVIYVDYGNFDIVSVSDIKQIKPEWLQFPAKFFAAEVDYKLIEKQQEPYLKKHMQGLIGESKLIAILNEHPLRIHIYEKEKDVLYYDKFLKNGVIELCK